VQLTIVSAHRTPERMNDYAKSAKDRGLEVIIVGAGGAAHLPGKYMLTERTYKFTVTFCQDVSSKFELLKYFISLNNEVIYL
jgi:phosphoribosylcarboxyaminoimidazole (NCAIR) mutase